MKTAPFDDHCNISTPAAPSCWPRPVEFLGILVLLLCVSSPAWGQDIAPTSRSFEKATFDLDRFTEKSDVIVRGIVSSKKAKFIDKAIYTQYDLVVQETLQGRPQSTVTVAVLGGVVGNIGLAVPDAPNLSIGDEIVLFGEAFPGQASFKAVGLGAGVVAVHPGGGESPTVKPRGRPERLDEFLDEVRSKKKKER